MSSKVEVDKLVGVINEAKWLFNPARDNHQDAIVFIQSWTDNKKVLSDCSGIVSEISWNLNVGIDSDRQQRYIDFVRNRLIRPAEELRKMCDDFWQKEDYGTYFSFDESLPGDHPQIVRATPSSLGVVAQDVIITIDRLIIFVNRELESVNAKNELPQQKEVPQRNDPKTAGLSVMQIALLFAYRGDDAILNNAQRIAEDYAKTSGQYLRQQYNKVSRPDFRIRHGCDSSRGGRSFIRDIEKILEYLTDTQRVIAENEIKVIEREI